jgi:hypothetical protein
MLSPTMLRLGSRELRVERSGSAQVVSLVSLSLGKSNRLLLYLSTTRREHGRTLTLFYVSSSQRLRELTVSTWPRMGSSIAKWLASRGVFVPQTFDTMLAAHMLDENRLKGLKPLSQTLLGAAAYNVGVETTDCFHAPLRQLLLYNATGHGLYASALQLLQSTTIKLKMNEEQQEYSRS